MGMGYVVIVGILWSGYEVLGGYVVWLWVCTLVRVCMHVVLSEGGYVL